jgi:hypothetical protein
MNYQLNELVKGWWPKKNYKKALILCLNRGHHVILQGRSHQTLLRIHPSIHPFAPSLCFRYKTMSAEYAIVYAALILQDDGIEITVSSVD